MDGMERRHLSWQRGTLMSDFSRYSNLLELVVLSHNRPGYLSQCIKSIVSQETAFTYRLLVSDNSTNDLVAEMLANCWPEIETRRFPGIPAVDHFRKAIELASSDFLMIYHDDDLLLPGCLQAMLSQLVADPALSAVACNANFYYADGTQVS
jgi:glycosyltransferase involved in cell wall biosynthesis